MPGRFHSGAKRAARSRLSASESPRKIAFAGWCTPSNACAMRNIITHTASYPPSATCHHDWPSPADRCATDPRTAGEQASGKGGGCGGGRLNEVVYDALDHEDVRRRLAFAKLPHVAERVGGV